ncbi:PREDICTED: uncharacterized protein LOC107880373 [Prunus mume]|uniref:Uncharacterized protein LOC107880373 n=1 Tax=Prunus mume TaxID=102107 RepID=A0ABM1LIE1_PRUMU|nr:PREDICTED: uncharacterized protein LOC107880373 [Prunus mume]
MVNKRLKADLKFPVVYAGYTSQHPVPTVRNIRISAAARSCVSNIGKEPLFTLGVGTSMPTVSGGPVQVQGGAPTPPVAGKVHYHSWNCTSASEMRCTEPVANRERPLANTDPFLSLRKGIDGNLRLVDGKQNTVWSTSVTTSLNNLEAVLLDTGNFILRDHISGGIFWESFDYPCDTFLPEMMLGLNTKTGERRFLDSWKSANDPSSGTFVIGVTAELPHKFFFGMGQIHTGEVANEMD